MTYLTIFVLQNTEQPQHFENNGNRNDLNIDQKLGNVMVYFTFKTVLKQGQYLVVLFLVYQTLEEHTIAITAPETSNRIALYQMYWKSKLMVENGLFFEASAYAYWEYCHQK